MPSAKRQGKRKHEETVEVIELQQESSKRRTRSSSINIQEKLEKYSNIKYSKDDEQSQCDTECETQPPSQSSSLVDVSHKSPVIALSYSLGDEKTGQVLETERLHTSDSDAILKAEVRKSDDDDAKNYISCNKVIPSIDGSKLSNRVVTDSDEDSNSMSLLHPPLDYSFISYNGSETQACNKDISKELNETCRENIQDEITENTHVGRNNDMISHDKVEALHNTDKNTSVSKDALLNSAYPNDTIQEPTGDNEGKGNMTSNRHKKEQKSSDNDGQKEMAYKRLEISEEDPTGGLNANCKDTDEDTSVTNITGERNTKCITNGGVESSNNLNENKNSSQQSCPESTKNEIVGPDEKQQENYLPKKTIMNQNNNKDHLHSDGIELVMQKEYLSTDELSPGHHRKQNALNEPNRNHLPNANAFIIDCIKLPNEIDTSPISDQDKCISKNQTDQKDVSATDKNSLDIEHQLTFTQRFDISVHQAETKRPNSISQTTVKTLVLSQDSVCDTNASPRENNLTGRTQDFSSSLLTEDSLHAKTMVSQLMSTIVNNFGHPSVTNIPDIAASAKASIDETSHPFRSIETQDMTESIKAFPERAESKPSIMMEDIKTHDTAEDNGMNKTHKYHPKGRHEEFLSDKESDSTSQRDFVGNFDEESLNATKKGFRVAEIEQSCINKPTNNEEIKGSELHSERIVSEKCQGSIETLEVSEGNVTSKYDKKQSRHLNFSTLNKENALLIDIFHTPEGIESGSGSCSRTSEFPWNTETRLDSKKICSGKNLTDLDSQKINACVDTRWFEKIKDSTKSMTRIDETNFLTGETSSDSVTSRAKISIEKERTSINSTFLASNQSNDHNKNDKLLAQNVKKQCSKDDDDFLMMMTDSQLCQVSSETELESFHNDKKQKETREHVEKKREEGKNLVRIVLNELASVNRQLLKLRREMDMAKRKLAVNVNGNQQNSLQQRLPPVKQYQQQVSTMFQKMPNSTNKNI